MARAALSAVVRWLRTLNDRAAASLEEGFDETLTVHRLGLTAALRATLSTTNPIESAFDRVKALAARVKRWRDAKMVMRWTASGLVLAEGSFRRIKGYADLPILLTALANTPLHSTETAA